jgi:hypothetical protein
MAEISLILTASAAGAPATAVAVADGGTGVASIPPAAIKSLLDAREQIIKMMNGAPRMSSDDLRRFGQIMGKALFSDDVGATWTNANAPAVPLITKLLATSPELKAIPWEYAAWPSGQDGPQLATSVVRLVPQARAVALAPIPKGELRILLLSASPLNLNAIPWDDVRDAMQPLRDQRRQAVEAFAHVHRLGIRIHRDAATVPSHRSSASNRAAVSIVSPSTRGTPSVMVITTGTAAGARSAALTATRRNRRRAGATRVHRWSVLTEMPNVVAIVRTPSCARRCCQYTTACCWSAGEYRRRCGRRRFS